MSLAELEDIAETHAFCADRLSIETERADRVAREVCDRGCSYTGGPDEECSAHGRTPRELWEFIAQDVVGRDAATERAEKAEAERDAALAEIERVREMHRPESNERYTWCVGCSTDEYLVDWPCRTVAALDGAPEPEWEYGFHLLGDDGNIYKTRGGWDTPERAQALGDEWIVDERESHMLNDQPDIHVALIRRRKASPWLPIEKEQGNA